MLDSHVVVTRAVALLGALLLSVTALDAQQRPRAGDLGITPLIGGTAGVLNAITDVRGVEVGHSTIIRGAAGPLVVGTGPVRTGVTIVHPRAAPATIRCSAPGSR